MNSPAPAGLRLACESPQQPEVQRLIEALDAYQMPLYPAESHHGIPIEALLQPEVIFAVARQADGRAVGCGAVVRSPGWGEIKRMFADPAVRGLGIGRALLGFLEQRALEAGCHHLKLETGIHQHAALRLYRQAGYADGPPFGDYQPDPHSVFLHKALRA